MQEKHIGHICPIRRSRVKVIALSETAINDTAINYHIPICNCEMNIRHRRRGGRVNLYVHCTFQYKLRNYLLLGGVVNSVFVELLKKFH